MKTENREMNDSVDSLRVIQMNKRLLDIKELSQYTGIPELTIRKLLQEKRIPVTRVNRRIYFDIGKIDQWFTLRTIEPAEPERGESFNRKEQKGNSAIKVRFPLDDDSKTQLNFSPVIKWGKPLSNPVKGIRFFEDHEPKEMVLTSEQEEALLKASPPYLQQVILVALNTGMRLGEIEGLKWSDVDMENGVIFVRRTKSKNPGECL